VRQLSVQEESHVLDPKGAKGLGLCLSLVDQDEGPEGGGEHSKV